MRLHSAFHKKIVLFCNEYNSMAQHQSTLHTIHCRTGIAFLGVSLINTLRKIHLKAQQCIFGSVPTVSHCPRYAAS